MAAPMEHTQGRKRLAYAMRVPYKYLVTHIFSFECSSPQHINICTLASEGFEVCAEWKNEQGEFCLLHLISVLIIFLLM